MKPVENLGVAYHDQLAEGWSDLYSSPGFGKRKTVFQKVITTYVEPEQRWLDAGCGSGVLSRLLAEHGASVLGIDASVPMLESAKHHVSTSPLADQVGFQFVETVEDLGEVEGEFDGIVCSSVVEYVTYPKSVLKEFRRKLKPGGVLIISVPNKYSVVRFSQKVLRAFGKPFGRKFAPYLDVSLNEYSKSEFRAMLERHDFECLNRFDFDPVLPSQLVGIPRSLMIFVATCGREGEVS